MDYTNAFGRQRQRQAAVRHRRLRHHRSRAGIHAAPAGIYSARVLRGEYCSTKAGDEAYRMRFEVTEGTHVGQDRYSHLDVRSEGAAVHETRPRPLRADHQREAAIAVPRSRAGIPRAARGRAAARRRRHRTKRHKADRPTPRSRIAGRRVHAARTRRRGDEVTAACHNVGAYVLGAPTSPRALVRHADLLNAYADGAMRETRREAYLSHFVFGPEMQRHYAANRQSVAGFAGPCCCRWLVLDIDRADLVEALADARRLVRAVYERYPEMDGDVAVYFSGGKGFHVLIELAHNPPPAVGFQHVARTFAETLAARAGVKIDTAIYDMNHIIRLPNTQHPRTGLFKRRIDSEALFAPGRAAHPRTGEASGGGRHPGRACVVPRSWRKIGTRPNGKPPAPPTPAPPAGVPTPAPPTRGRRVTSWISCGSAWTRANGIKPFSAAPRG